MLVIKHLHTFRHPFSITILLAMMSISNTPDVYADSNKNEILSEPISPIPLEIQVDITKARLGQRLFFDSRLSGNNSMSCATCHQLKDGGDDNRSLSGSDSAKFTLNTPTVFNASFNFRQNWDGSAQTLQQQVDMKVYDHDKFDTTWTEIIKKLNKDSELQRNFSTTYKDGITQENIVDAIVEYEKTLYTPNSRFDRYLRLEEKLSSEEQQGYTLFKELGCVSCHQGTNVGGNLFQKFGLFYDYIAQRGEIHQQDYGRFNVSQREMDKFVFKVPSLRNVAVTAPYLHDGSAESLEDAIRIMGKTQLGRSLNDREVALIRSFLNTLTGEYQNRLLDSQS